MKKHLLKQITGFIILCLLVSASRVNGQCNANFSFSIANGTVSFVNTSTGTYSTTVSYWNFGDGTNQYNPQNTSPNAIHTYSGNGTYSVTLHISDSLTTMCTSFITQTIAITTASCIGNASFTHTLLQNGLVNFFNTSSGSSLTYAWNFGDGGTSTANSPAHTYSTDSIYNITLIATGPACTFSTVQTVAVTVAQCLVNASFTSAVSGSTVNFTNTSSNISGTNTSHYWSFGDGSTSQNVNPVHNYAANGPYYVSLTINSNYGYLQCTDSTGGVVNITGGPCTANANFYMSKDSLMALTWNIFPSQTANVTGAIWSWGDGSSSTGLFPSHTYSAAGTYSICLTVTTTCSNGTATATYCSSSSIYKMSGGNAINVRVIDPANPLSVNMNTEEETLAVFPNPAGNYVKLRGKGMEGASVRIVNILGATVYTGTWDRGNIKEINTSALPAGNYFVKISTDSIEINKKMIITE